MIADWLIAPGFGPTVEEGDRLHRALRIVANTWEVSNVNSASGFPFLFNASCARMTPRPVVVPVETDGRVRLVGAVHDGVQQQIANRYLAGSPSRSVPGGRLRRLDTPARAAAARSYHAAGGLPDSHARSALANGAR